MHRTSLVATMALSLIFFACGAGDNIVGTESEPDGGGPQLGLDATDSCTGCGVASAKLALSSADVCLSAPVGQQSAAKTFTVANTGGVASGPLTGTLSGPAGQSFIITSNTCTGSGLAAGGACSVAVAYAPTAAHASPESATLWVTDGESSASAPLVGYDVGTVTATPVALSFGEVAPGSTSDELLVQVTTTAGCETRWTAVVDRPDFLISSDTCTGQAAKPGDICQIGVRFSPSPNQGPSAVAGQLTLNTTDSRTVTVSLNGTIAKRAPQSVPLSVSTAVFDFGEVTVGQSGTASITVVSGGATITASLDSQSSPAFSIAVNTCEGSLAPGETCKIQVQFAPIVAGVNIGNLRLTDGQTAVTVSLKGLGIAAQSTVPFSVSPAAIDFGEVAVGKSVRATLTVTVATSPERSFTLTLAGAAPSAVTIDTNGCVTKVPAGGTCTFSLSYAPTEVSQAVAELHVTDGTYDVAASVTGKGVRP